MSPHPVKPNHGARHGQGPALGEKNHILVTFEKLFYK
jgi:hypothetical protein